MRPDDIKPKDLRKYSILPFNAVMDKRINRTRALHVLAALCSYVDRNGVTFVSQDRLAADLGISRQAVNKQLTILKDLGYWVYARKRYKDQKTSSVKVIYDPDVTTGGGGIQHPNSRPSDRIERGDRCNLWGCRCNF